ncbi:DUF4350 domain-containing protein [Streptomyces sp. B6B3]|uniref:DUF4350 domain-containing protein n=1 Tax=Streptomyces sp. B6B3 TaxID=3153570 RepID=UPI00325EFBAC
MSAPAVDTVRDGPVPDGSGPGTDGPPAAPTAVSPDARQLWRRGRGLLVAAAILVLAGLIIALFSAGEDGSLHPRSATPHGSRAVAELLAERGVTTTLVSTAAAAAAAAGPDTTLLVARPDAVTERQLRDLREATRGSGGGTLLVAADQSVVDVFAPGVGASDPVPASELAPACAANTADGRRLGRDVGSVELGGHGYLVGEPLPPSTPFACYPLADSPVPLPTLLALDAGAGGDTVLLGSPDILYNESLDEHGNAALALNLLGSRPHLVWYLPAPGDVPPDEDSEGLVNLLDPGWRWAALQLGVAAALAALWRGRRLGPVVTERLPVTVRAAETTEGRARLYHQTRARDRAAEALRAAARTRLAPLVGVPPRAAHAPEQLPSAVAARAGRDPAVVHALLFGPPPPDDAALVRLADDLDALERRVAPAASGPPHPAGP